ncbi:enoyl-CoA hydratase/carnithine racemase [Nitzschia inconspicua]|uniref:Enoyl-CoA hydratase/carnithine racemase n=1 Tax=Nitzschia inconspicua TaxID=303405 RepID=A0A9K3PTI4_9STRA|nr:enoyl-CoA hydratase/carnithine racemase [Nitzschia inconspicua]
MLRQASHFVPARHVNLDYILAAVCHQKGGSHGRCSRMLSSSRSSNNAADTDIDSETNSRDRVTANVDSHGVCHVRLNRPDKLNACDLAMFEAIARTASDLRQDRSLRAVILSGQGRAFCTGLDVKAVMKNGNPKAQINRLLERPSGYGPNNDNAIGNLAQDVSILWRELPVPVIAVLHGMCYGAGFQIALGADFRYATPHCKLSIMEGKWGLIPDMGASILLKELVSIDVAKELTMTAKIISGEEAHRLGLVTHVYDDPMPEAERFVKDILERSPDAIAAAKELYQSTWTATSDKESLILETKLQEKLLISWNQLAASGRSAFGINVPYSKRKE